MGRKSCSGAFSTGPDKIERSPEKGRACPGARMKTAPYYTRDRSAGRFLDRRIPVLRICTASHFPMKPGTLTHTIAVLLSSVSALFTQSAPAAVPGGLVKLSKKSSKPQAD